MSLFMENKTNNSVQGLYRSRKSISIIAAVCIAISRYHRPSTKPSVSEERGQGVGENELAVF